NLTLNGIQAMPQGGALTVECRNVRNRQDSRTHIASLPAGPYVEITVHDEGVGIPQENLTRIFDPYFSTKHTGSGLGLATTYSIVKKHQGQIFVESSPDCGTTFSIYLPASTTQQSAREREVVPLTSGTGRVLVLDDDDIVREIVGSMLTQLGYVPILASEGNAAVQLYREHLESGKRIHAVIMDLTIPGGVGGREALALLKRIDPDVRAIVSSGYSTDPVMADYESFGFCGVVAKPYELTELSQVLASVLSGPVNCSEAIPHH
ncbi:MAG: response regulator, partial [Bdellovibrionales bacterium]|nr:response regulator [Bdellovibrionales bacterium]